MWVPPVHSPFSATQALGALSAGPGALDLLAERLTAELDARQALLTDSGTHALQIALETALDAAAPERRAVALPAFTCFDVGTAALAVGAPVVFYDIEPESLTPVRASLEGAIARGAGAAVVAHLFGFPLDWDALDEVRESTGCLMIEDAAQGWGTLWKGRPGGSCGDLTVLSFGRGKGWTGSGGGAVLARGGLSLDTGRALPPARGGTAGLAARALAQWLLGRPALYGLPARVPALGLGETHLRTPTPAAAMRAYQADLLLRSQAAARAERAVRTTASERLSSNLEGLPGLEFSRPLPGGQASYLRLPVRLAHAPVEIPLTLRSLGVYRSYPEALPDLRALSRLTLESGDDWPGARALARTLLTLPTHSRSGGARTAPRIRQALEALAPA